MNNRSGILLEILSIVVLLVIILVIIIGYVSGSVGVEGLSVISTTVLTTALVILYYKQAETQRTQSKIMENQEEMMEVGISPHLVVEHITPSGADTLSISISNLGEGTAKKISLLTDYHFIEMNRDRYVRNPVELERKGDKYYRSGAAVQGGAELVEFTAESRVDDPDNRGDIRIKELINREALEDEVWTNDFYVEFFIQYEDQLGQQYIAETPKKNRFRMYYETGQAGGTSLAGLKRSFSWVRRDHPDLAEWTHLPQRYEYVNATDSQRSSDSEAE